MPPLDHIEKSSVPKFVILPLLYKRIHNAKKKPFTILSFLLFVFLCSFGCIYFMCVRYKFDSNEWQTEMNFAALGFKLVKGICANHTEFCNVVSKVGNSFSISFEVKNITDTELESSIIAPTLVGIGVEYLSIAYGNISQKIRIYTPDNQDYFSLIAATIVTNALYTYNTSSDIVFITTTFNPQRTVNTMFQVDLKSIIFIPIMYLIIGLYPMLYPAMERTRNVKLLQLMTGVSFIQYWLSNLVFDFLQLIFISLPYFALIISFLFAGCITFISSFETLIIFVVIIILYFLATITMSYLLSLFFDGIAIVLLLKLAIFIAAIAVFAVPVDFIKDASKFFMENIFTIYPVIGMFKGVANVSLYSNVDDYCSKLFSLWPSYCENKENYQPQLATTYCCEDFAAETVGWKLFIQQVIQYALFGGFFIAVIVVEKAFEAKNKMRFDDDSYTAPKNEDSDVSAMREKAVKVFQDNYHSQFALSALNITKIYNQTVVDHLTFLVESKQCFGLLGVNGAGKTTTFKMLIAEIGMTYGESFIGSNSVFTNSEDYRRSIGYCPQFDAFVANLSGEEMLYLFGRLRGYNGKQLHEVVDNIIKLVDLQEHAKYIADNYSGGNKRKLSIGMAIIGFPKVMFLDEPTAGVDPVARRKVWKIIETCRQTLGSSLILTSHAMDECEHLCSVIAIMVKGSFRCFGSTQHLKSKFGKGVTITLKLDPNMKNIDDVKKDFMAVLPKATLKDEHTTQLTYHFDDPSVSLGNVFRSLEVLKDKYKLEDYQVTDSDLEQIFLSFARQQ